MPVNVIDVNDMQPCDAFQLLGEGASGHVALFLGWQSPGVPLVVEECGHESYCCGDQATCPGACGPTGDDCNEYCNGCPIQRRAWTWGFNGFRAIRRNGW
jgi:hypothetical protein